MDDELSFRHDGIELTIAVPTDEVETTLRHIGEMGHEATDTGRRVTTDDGLDAEALVQVSIRAVAARRPTWLTP